jgi:bacteriocin biosynthesis cyclodehydratase domain-containing protein
MVLLIDPRLPVVWRTPFELQIGSDRAVVTLKEITQPEEYLVAVLRKGISRSGLDMIGTKAGATPTETEALLAKVAPALLGESAERSLLGRSIVVIGRGAGADGIRSLLRELGATVSSVSDDDTGSVDLAVLVACFAIQPSLSGYWLRRDVPHLAVVFGDATARVGPLVEPGHGPCLHCVERARLDLDPTWAAVASQLLGRSAATEVTLTVAEVVPLAVRAVLDRLAPGTGAKFRGAKLRRRAVVIDGESGELSELRFQGHPECACRELPLQGIGTATGQSSGPDRIESTTAPAVAARA